MNRYFYSLENDENGKKIIHLSGNVYLNDADGTDTCYRVAEWTWLYIDVNEAQLMLDTDAFYDYINERVAYLGDHTKEEAIEVCATYFDGQSGTKLHIADITSDTPCGDYWFE